ncbi:hypothetical protein [Actinomadura sp. 21ATH]|uniref:hypothetical protein n=1 Tax=Actinomadura sp. 21ATH TaxID=1735444 RepID=UPI0035C0A0A9
MVSMVHDFLIELFRNRPALAVELLESSAGIDLPEFREISLDSGDLNDCSPTEYRADAVVVLSGDSRKLGIVVEVQLRRDPDKRWSWPVYVTTLRARLKCPVVLLVISPTSGVGTWCAAPIELGGPRSMLTPFAIGPEAVPVVEDIVQAQRAPELAVLSAMAHGSGPSSKGVLTAAMSSFAGVDDDRARLYADFVLARLDGAARRTWEELMKSGTYEYQSDFARKYVAEGRAEGRVEGLRTSILDAFDEREIEVPDEVRNRILQCQDARHLRAWFRRAMHAESADEIFD